MLLAHFNTKGEKNYQLQTGKYLASTDICFQEEEQFVFQFLAYAIS